MLRTSMLSSLLAVVPATAILAAPPTAEEIEAKTGAAMTYYREQGENFDLESPEFIALLDAQLADVDPNDCDLSQIKDLEMLWAYSPKAKPIWMERIRTLGDDDQWLDVALLLANLGDIDAALDIGQMRGGLPAVPDERLGEVINTLGRVDRERMLPMQSDLVILADRIPKTFETLLGWEVYPLLLEAANVDAATRNRIRMQVIEAFENAAATVEDDRTKSGCMSRIAYLEGAAGRGELIGYPAPKVDFTWNSDGEAWNCFGCLRGKVVVLDFWTTWCGPCVASFPKVRALVDHYDGYDVVVLGLTSPQNAVYFRDERGRQQPEDFDAECELMAEFKTSMDMTWPIVMTEQDVINPDFAVKGIPHVAIIAPDGKVAYNRLHPAGDMGEKVEKINGLLEKAGKKTPGPWTPKIAKPNTDQG